MQSGKLDKNIDVQVVGDGLDQKEDKQAQYIPRWVEKIQHGDLGKSEVASIKGKPLAGRKPYSKLLFFDVDGTILNYDITQSTHSPVPIIINPEKLRELLKTAHEDESVLVIVITSRYAPDSLLSSSPLSIIGTLKEIGIEYFDIVIYTNGVYKACAIDFLSKYNYGAKAFLLDDNQSEIDACRELGHDGALVGGIYYLRQAKKFIASENRGHKETLAFLEEDKASPTLTNLTPKVTEPLVIKPIQLLGCISNAEFVARAVLGFPLTEPVTEEDINRVFHAYSLQYSPDKHSGEEKYKELFQKISSAVNILRAKTYKFENIRSATEGEIEAEIQEKAKKKKKKKKKKTKQLIPPLIEEINSTESKALESIMQRGTLAEFESKFKTLRLSPDAILSDGNSLLYQAVFYNRYDIAKFLLLANADPNLIPKGKKEAPIHCAAGQAYLPSRPEEAKTQKESYANMIKLLVEKKASPNMPDYTAFRRSSLHIALERTFPIQAILKALIDSGANAEQTNAFNETSLEFIDKNPKLTMDAKALFITWCQSALPLITASESPKTSISKGLPAESVPTPDKSQGQTESSVSNYFNFFPPSLSLFNTLKMDLIATMRNFIAVSGLETSESVSFQVFISAMQQAESIQILKEAADHLQQALLTNHDDKSVNVTVHAIKEIIAGAIVVFNSSDLKPYFLENTPLSKSKVMPFLTGFLKKASEDILISKLCQAMLKLCQSERMFIGHDQIILSHVLLRICNTSKDAYPTLIPFLAKTAIETPRIKPYVDEISTELEAISRNTNNPDPTSASIKKP